MTPFGDRLEEAFQLRGHLCVGIDPHSWLLSKWSLDDSAAGAREFGLRVVDAAFGRAAFVKPQVSFFERFGSAGFAALERILAEARSAGILSIADAKRGDIGSTLEAYAQAWLRPGAPLEADALTLSPYLGVASLHGALSYAAANGKGVFVLAATSNPEAATLQKARLAEADTSIAASVLADLHAVNAAGPSSRFGSAGAVLGATLNLRGFGIDIDAEQPGAALPVLAPGFGHQGAVLGDLRTIFGSLSSGVIVSESRSILEAGPEGIADAIARRADEVEAHRG
ncbi:orotidine-5'-phosphate decarboxylase [Rathayibacter sp. YIM 133350]|uniref:orotidine-5'-phosphate decarboxylase n=1 Tax=Rathayibacter sp. YIM 133350 TaxID=3131992 RepID=UPI00307DA276